MTPEDLERAHRALAPSLFNRVWELMDKKNRTEDETDEMLHAAHASRHHWMTIGEPVNLVRGDWQVSRAYCVAGRPELALYWADRCHTRCVSEGIGDFDLAFAYEALARAHAMLGNKKEARMWRDKAEHAGELISEKDDKDFFAQDLASIESLLIE